MTAIAIPQSQSLSHNQKVFSGVLLALIKSGQVARVRLAVEASTIETNAAMRSIVLRDAGETYQQMLDWCPSPEEFQTMTGICRATRTRGSPR